jgi:hypothetical protein
MRLTVGLLVALFAFVPSASEASPPESPANQPESPSSPEAPAESDAPEQDLLGELVVEAKRRPQLVLPKIAVLSSPDGQTFLHDLLERDLELSGEFDVLELNHPMGFDDPFDATPFKNLGLEAVLTANVREQDDGRIE